MARRIEYCLRISGTLVAESPLHVGGLGVDTDVDLTLAVDGQGALYVPGTSLAGALRDFMRRRGSDAEANQLWGYQEGDQGHASFLLVEDAPVQMVADREIREGVGIDRNTGTASERIKYNREVLPKGTCIGLSVTMEVVSSQKQSRQVTLLLDLLRALERGDLGLGAARTRGLGAVRLKDLRIREDRLLDRAGMLATLRALGTRPDQNANMTLKALESRGGAAGALSPSPLMELKVRWHPLGPIMVKAERDGMAVDMLPLVSAVDKNLTLVLPGSSLKGALRSHAERIVRTVCRIRGADTEMALIGGLFGSPGQRAVDLDTVPQISTDPLPGLGALGVRDCYATSRFSPEQWSQVEMAANERDLRVALDGAGLVQTQQAFHVAVDRWTGGAGEGFLYSVLEPHAFSWDPMTLRFDPARLAESERQAALALVLLTLQDMARGRLPLGFGTGRGMGAVAVDAIVMRSTETGTFIPGLPEEITLTGGPLSGMPANVRETLAKGWQRWIDANQEGA